ncbi:hypothetical protein COK55_08525 [Bacillus cereus]|nr:hypothetical protein COK55_08525 [Bacillus cereus]
MFQVLMVYPHHHQAKKSKYPKTRKLTSQVKKHKFFVSGRYKVLNLMAWGHHIKIGLHYEFLSTYILIYYRL